GGTDELIELDGFYEGLESGRWVIVSGERDIAGTSGVRFSELAMLSTVTQDVQLRQIHPGTTGTAPPPTPLAGDKTHSFIKLANKLEYCFKRDTVTIYGNVVKATHGETRKEVLGSGDGAKVLQAFTLKQPPLTFVSASNPSGVDSTLTVFVNDVEWHETDSLAGLSSTGRSFITQTDDEDKTTVIFGNGKEGARLPTGIENVKSEYRNGIGKPGNVKAGQISLLVTRPLGVKEVINPLRASGGADRESRDQARKNAPLAVKALDRLVSVQDYADFARTYAGIGKARAEELSDGQRQLVHVTIAGADDIPIDKTSDLFQNLRRALLDFGDPYQPIDLAVRELMFIVISANVRIHPNYQWEKTEPTIRAALLEAFGFERRELGQDVLLSEVISVMQVVRGVVYVDVDVLRGIPEKIADEQGQGQRRLLTPDEITSRVRGPLKDDNEKILKEPLSRITVNLAAREGEFIRPAQLAFLTPDVPATLILNQIT
ncbi:MAG: putative baseplate assembly protein, partial [Gammaproteobacteria bacterium]